MGRSATIEFVGHVAATLDHEAVFRQLPVMLLVTARPRSGAPPRSACSRRASQESVSRSLHLDGLDELGVFSLLEARTGVRPSETLLHLIVRQPQGTRSRSSSSSVASRELVLEVRDGELSPTVHEVPAFRSTPTPTSVTSCETLRTDEAVGHDAGVVARGRVGTLRVGSGLEADSSKPPSTKRPTRACSRTTVHASTSSTRALGAPWYTASRGDDNGCMPRSRDASWQRRPTIRLRSRRSRSRWIVRVPKATRRTPAGRAGSPADEALALGMWNDAARYFEATLRSPVTRRPRARRARSRRAAIAAYHAATPLGGRAR